MTDLRDLAAPDEAGAASRAWTAIEAEPLPHRHRSRAPVLVAALVAVLVAGLAFTPPGDAVATWVKRAVGVEAKPTRPKPTGLERLPGGGRVLVVTPDLWAVGGGAAPRKLLGAVDEASWSPHALNAVAVRNGTELIAVDTKGQRRWHVAPLGAGPVRAPRWSNDGFRIAYFKGQDLRVVIGDGTDDRLFARAHRGPAPAWRPGRAHLVAYLNRHWRVVLGDVDSARVIWRGPSLAATALAWSADGRRLVVLGPHDASVLDGATGRVLRRFRPPRGAVHAAVVADRRGHGFTVLRRTGNHAEVVHVQGARVRRLFAADDVTRIAPSPDGRWLLVGWRQIDAWLFLPLGDPGSRARQVSQMSRRFAHGAPVLAGWCCPPH